MLSSDDISKQTHRHKLNKNKKTDTVGSANAHLPAGIWSQMNNKIKVLPQVYAGRGKSVHCLWKLILQEKFTLIFSNSGFSITTTFTSTVFMRRFSDSSAFPSNWHGKDQFASQRSGREPRPFATAWRFVAKMASLRGIQRNDCDARRSSMSLAGHPINAACSRGTFPAVVRRQ